LLTAERMAPTDPLWVRLTPEDVARLDGTRAAEGHGRWRLPEAQRRLGVSREEIRLGMRAGRFVGYREWTGARWEWRISPADDPLVRAGSAVAHAESTECENVGAGRTDAARTAAAERMRTVAPGERPVGGPYYLDGGCSMDMLEQQMIEVDGATLEVFVGGAGALTVGQSHPCVAAQPTGGLAHELSDGFRLVRVNARGMGRSSAGRGPHDYTFRQHLDDLEAVRRHLGVERWVWWGTSGGGAIGVLYALQAPDALAGLIVDKMGPSGRRLGADARSALSAKYPEYQEYVRAAAPLRRRPSFLDPFGPVPAEWLQLREGLWVLTEGGTPAIIATRDDDRAKPCMEEFVSAYDVRDRLGEIRTPTLVVAGGRDPVVPADECRLLHAGIPGAELVVLEQTGHVFSGPDSPDHHAYRAALQRFLSGIR
jgi:proline iminopeptidase